jgi:hypothetical protein
MEAPHHGQTARDPAPSFRAPAGREGSAVSRAPTVREGSACPIAPGGGSGAVVAALFTWEPHDPQKFTVSEIFVPQLVQNIFSTYSV